MSAFSTNFNDAQEQRDFGQIIPDGTFVKLKGALKAGGATVPEASPLDAGLFKLAKPPSDAVMLDFDFVIMFGPHAKHHVFQMFTVDGGKRDDKGASKAGTFTKATLRAMVESALGIQPKDESPEGKAKRAMRGFSDLNGIEFAARLGVEAGGDKGDGTFYNDKNVIAHIVTPNEPEWQAVMAGQEVEPKPASARAARAGGASAAQASKPAWQQNAAPATAVGGQSALWAAGQPGATPATQQPVAETAGQPAPAADGPAWMRG